MKTPTGEKATSVKISALTYRRVRRLAKLEQRTMQTIIDRAVASYEKTEEAAL